MYTPVPRFFIEVENGARTDSFTLKGDDARHIRTVLRLREGARITVCDGAGADYDCELTAVGREETQARVLTMRPSAGEPSCGVTLVQSLPRSDKFDYVVQKCVEAGIRRIIPVVSEYSQFAWKRGAGAQADGAGKRLARWRRIAYEAAKQCGRGIVPEVGEIMDFKASLETISPENKLLFIPYENENATTLKDVLVKSRLARPGSGIEIVYFIGPEGGFSADEINCCIEFGIAPVTLGPRILRTETAGLYVLSQIMYEFE